MTYTRRLLNEKIGQDAWRGKYAFMELLLPQWGDLPELYRNTDSIEATEIVMMDSQMNCREKLDTCEESMKKIPPDNRWDFFITV